MGVSNTIIIMSSIQNNTHYMYTQPKDLYRIVIHILVLVMYNLAEHMCCSCCNFECSFYFISYLCEVTLKIADLSHKIRVLL